MIDVEFFTKLDSMSLALKRHTIGKYQGEQKTSYVGDGLTFKDFSRYVVGDDFRKIDWKVYARTKELYVRRYEADKNLTVHILLDSSASMGYFNPAPKPKVDADKSKNQNQTTRQVNLSKFDYAAMMALGIAHMSAKNRERVEFSLFNETLTPLKLQSQNMPIRQMVHRINQINPTGAGDFDTLLKLYRDRVKSKSLIFIFSDFLYSPAKLKTLLSQYHKSQVFLVQVLHADEISLPFDGDTKFINPENTTQFIKAYVTKTLQRNYQKQLLEHTLAIEQICGRNAVYIQLNTGQDSLRAFLQVMTAI
jgi:uncharacterized protein (DUF58 family)